MDPMTIEQKRQALQDLTAARALIRDISTWTQGALARDKDGERIEATHYEAVGFCALGAIERVTYGAGSLMNPNPEEASARETRAARCLARALNAEEIDRLAEEGAFDADNDDERIEIEREIVSTLNDAHYQDDDQAEAREDHAAILKGYDDAIARLTEELAR